MNKTHNAYRTDLSPYHHEAFRLWEAQELEALGNIHYGNDFQQGRSNILLTNTHTRFESFSEKQVNDICLIIHANSGYDNIPVDFARIPHFEIVVGNPIRAQAVATYVLTQIFSHYNSLPRSRSWHAGREWARRPMNSLKVLLLGFGHIGKIVFDSLSPVVDEILVHDPFIDKGQPDLTGRLSEVDVVIPLMSLNPTSRGMISETFLRSLKKDFVLINGARGGLVDQDSLIGILGEQPSAFAYLDVFQAEPFDEKEFSHLNNVKLSSHVAGVYTGIDRKIIDFEKQVVHDYLHLAGPAFRDRYRALILRNRIFTGFLL
jgi:D-3-phosphoglycerate dehydrogenase